MSHKLNMTRLKAVSNALAEWKEDVIFVGGATVSLYATSPEAIEARPTNDVDVVVELLSLKHFYQMQERLLELGFKNDIEAPIISRFIYQGIKVDFMPTDESILGFSNIWYKPGIKNAIEKKLDNGSSIKVFSPPYFIASKIEAFKSRGKNDLFASHDFEDLVFVLDNKYDIEDDLIGCPEDVRTYLKKEFSDMAKDSLFKEALLGHVEQLNQMNRVNKIMLLLKKVIA